MKRQIYSCISGCSGMLLLVCLLAGCSSRHEEMPITTTSVEARKFFIEGRELYENLREDEARELFYQAIEKDQNFALCHYYLADAAASAVDYHTHLVLAVQLAPKVSEGERLLIESLRARAENDPVRARRKMEELVQLYPNDKRAHRMLGYLFRRVDEERAIAEYEAAVKLDKNYAPAHNNLGYAYKRKGEFEKAIKAFKKYSDLLPDEANPHDSIAELYKKMGKYEESIEHYKKALELRPTFAFSHRQIGENLIFLGNFEEARFMFEEVQELDVTPNKKADALQMIAHSYVYEFKYDEALAACDRAMEFAASQNLPEWQATL
ncbi:MAG: tetratricopeptide repeat protein, partial [bacterium]